jgi:hypothetical protein
MPSLGLAYHLIFGESCFILCIRSCATCWACFLTSLLTVVNIGGWTAQVYHWCFKYVPSTTVAAARPQLHMAARNHSAGMPQRAGAAAPSSAFGAGPHAPAVRWPPAAACHEGRLKAGLLRGAHRRARVTLTTRGSSGSCLAQLCCSNASPNPLLPHPPIHPASIAARYARACAAAWNTSRKLFAGISCC